LEFTFEARLIEWRGPAPFVFAPMPLDLAEEFREYAKSVSYGWGCIAVDVKIGTTQYKTSLFPKDGTYFVPIKVAVQRAVPIALGDVAEISLTVNLVR
jgi:hypothetical protein